MNISIDRTIQWLVDTSARLFPWIQRMLEAWVRKTKDIWNWPNGMGKVLAIAWVLGWIVIMGYCAYILLFLIPILIMIAFIAAVWTSMRGRG